MRKLKFTSVLSTRISDFIAYRRSGGASYTSQARTLLRFDRFLCGIRFDKAYPTRDALQQYAASISNKSPGSRANRLSTIRQFCLYMHRFDNNCHVPKWELPSARNYARLPHIFTENEIKSLLAASLKLEPTHSLRPRMFYTLFGLLFSTGLRIGEAISMNIDDVDIERQLLHVRDSKFKKSRLVPMSDSTHAALMLYMRERNQVFPSRLVTPLFLGLRGHRMFRQNVDKTFRQLLDHCGLRTLTDHSGPCLHDLRHSYACNRLLLWYRQEKDVNALLPVLSTYLGHAEVAYTQVYLRATAELLEQANKRFLKNFQQNILLKGETL